MLNWLSLIFRQRASTPTAAAVKKPIVIPAKRSTTAVAIATASAIALAIPFVAEFEGYASRPYVDTVGTGRPITWCYGATKADGPVPPMSKRFTKAECQQLLGIDLVKYQAQVRKCVPKEQPPHREAALISFAYNLGPHTLCGPVGKNINAGNIAAGCQAMLAYDHAQGRRIAGLTRRRQAERTLCLRND